MIMYDRNGRELRCGDMVAYCPGYKCEIGIVKSGRSDGKIFVRYSEGDTAALTDSALLYKVDNLTGDEIIRKVKGALWA